MSAISKLFTVNGRVPWIPMLIAVLLSAALTASYIKLKRPPFIFDNDGAFPRAPLSEKQAPQSPAAPKPAARKKRTDEDPFLATGPIPSVVRVPIFFQEDEDDIHDERPSAVIDEIVSADEQEDEEDTADGTSAPRKG
jgi:hypothetical protein